MITVDDLQAICPKTRRARLEAFVEPLNAAMTEGQIDTPQRRAAFLAQLAHESGGFQYVREIWGPTPAQERYEGRADLGNTQPGDGKRYMGRGLIQITGRANYRACGHVLGIPAEDHPEILEEPINACRSAVWFWNSRRLSELADAGDFERITRRINGGLNGQPDRVAHYERALEALIA